MNTRSRSWIASWAGVRIAPSSSSGWAASDSNACGFAGVEVAEVAESGLEQRWVEVVRAHVVAREAHEPLAHPRHRARGRVHHLVDGEVEAQVGAGEAPRGLEVVDVARDEAEVGLVGGRQREVVAAERVVREVPDHRAGLESEQHRRQHRQQAGDGVGAAELAGVDAGLDLLLERLAEVAGQRLEHRPQRGQVQLGPLAGADAPAPGWPGWRRGR